MRVRWTKPAIEDIASIVRYIRRDDQAAALRVKRTIADSVSTLSSMPERGRKGEVDGTREMVSILGRTSPCTKFTKRKFKFFAYVTRRKNGQPLSLAC